MNEHIGRYCELAHAFTKEGYAGAFGIDLMTLELVACVRGSVGCRAGCLAGWPNLITFSPLPKVFGQDHWGHGLSGGFRGDIQDFAYLVNDLKQLVLDRQKALASHLPFFVLGATLGGGPRALSTSLKPIPPHTCPNQSGHSMGTIVAFHAAYELQHQHPGLVHGVVYSGCALVPGPSAASPFGIRCLFCLTQVGAWNGIDTPALSLSEFES